MSRSAYLALVHHPTLDREGKEVATAVTSLDLHDLSRLACTYGLRGVFATTPLPAQHALVARLLEHWLRGYGSRLNPSRRTALERLRVTHDLEEAVGCIQEREGVVPEIVGTSARDDGRRVGFRTARSRMQEEGRPILLLLGTGWGLAERVMERCDWVVAPIEGRNGYNHLSVRSAASILVDRLFGQW